MRRRNETEHAEVGTSAMIIFIALILVSSIISAIIIGVGGDVFAQSKTDASRNTPSMKGIANIVVLEIESLGADDGIHIVFELPYVEAEVPEEDLSWTVMCFPPNQGGGQNTIKFDQGDFELATTLDGDGATALPLIAFQPGVDYRMILQLDVCDLDELEDATLVMLVANGRTQEKFMDIGTAPYIGQDLN